MLGFREDVLSKGGLIEAHGKRPILVVDDIWGMCPVQPTTGGAKGLFTVCR
jgi:hypothetical protein